MLCLTKTGSQWNAQHSAILVWIAACLNAYAQIPSLSTESWLISQLEACSIHHKLFHEKNAKTCHISSSTISSSSLQRAAHACTLAHSTCILSLKSSSIKGSAWSAISMKVHTSYSVLGHQDSFQVPKCPGHAKVLVDGTKCLKSSISCMVDITMLLNTIG